MAALVLTPYTTSYTYAGFKYLMYLTVTGDAENAVPMSDQHHAAGKDKHRRAACEQYNMERRAR